MEEETAEQRSKAMQHLMVKKVGKQHSDSELLVALGAQAAGSVDSPWFGTSPQDIARQNSVMRSFAERHHLICAWPGEVYYSNGVPQRRPPAEILHSLDFMQQNSGACAIRGLLLAVLREWHAGTDAAAADCQLRLDMIECNLGVWVECMQALGLLGAPALNLEPAEEALLYTDMNYSFDGRSFCPRDPSLEKINLVQRRARALHQEFALHWTPRSEVAWRMLTYADVCSRAPHCAC